MMLTSSCRQTLAASLITLLLASPCLSEKPDETLEFSKWSGTVNVPDPVAISFDSAGRAYVTQTQRRKSQDLDIRRNTSWINDDLSLQTVQEKRDFYHQQMKVGGDSAKQAAHVADMNGDGVNDWRDLTVLSEKIFLVEDSDHDGTADKITLFAEDFKSEVTGIAAGVLEHEGNVYATVAPDVWRLADTDGDDIADTRDVMAHGFGLHIAYAGHDMHGLTIGPDGKIYWSIGDKGISVTTREGKRFHYPNQGGVLRCNPDGSDFEVFAHGLRNVQELAFDAYGNLFGVDNDADRPGESERFVYIVQGMDAGWRCNYQYRGDDYNPWTDENLWQTWPANKAANLIPPIRNYVDGPAGFTFNPGTALSPAYRDYFFLTGAPNGSQFAFRVQPNGASFEMVDDHQIGKGIPLVGINFGPDGALYGVDWGGGYPLNQTGAIWKIDSPEHANSPARTEVQQLLKEGFSQRDTPSLAVLLGHADQRVRLGAQFALVKRKEREAFSKILRDAIPENDAISMSTIHAIWGLGQLARLGDSEAASQLTESVNSNSPRISCQIARIARDLDTFDGRVYLKCLGTPDVRLQFHAALTLHYHPVADAMSSLLELCQDSIVEDGYLRHAIAMALAGCCSEQDLSGLHNHPRSAVRLAAVLALGHQRAPEIAKFVNDADAVVLDAVARAIHDDASIPEAMDALAGTSRDWSQRSEVFVRRAINANFRLGTSQHASNLAAFAVNDDAATELRVDAIRAIGQWLDPPELDRVTGRSFLQSRELLGDSEGKRPIPRGKLLQDRNSSRSVDRQEITRELTICLRSDSVEVSTAALTAVRELKLDFDSAALAGLVADANVPTEMRVEAMKTLLAKGSKELPAAIEAGLTSDKAALRIQSLTSLVRFSGERALPVVNRNIREAKTVAERQNAVRLLGKLDSAGRSHLADLVRSAKLGETEDAVVVDILSAARSASKQSAEIEKALEEYDQKIAEASASNPLAAFEPSLVGGDAAAGKQIFNTHTAAQCARCHRVGKKGSDVGPSLQKIGTTRDSKHLLRAMVLPSADIDKKYVSSSVILLSGQIVQGIVKSESKAETVIVTNQGKEMTIADDDIDDIVASKTSIMPPMDKVLTLSEIRDVVAYLKTLQK